MIIQFLLLLAILGLIVLFVRNRHGVRMQAGKRIGLVLFALMNIYAVLRPDDLTAVAHSLGVGRGTDLLLYTLVVAFLLAMLNYYLRFQGVDRRLTELARTLAIREAEIVNRDRGLLSGPDAVSTAVSSGQTEDKKTGDS
ncbi:DUF2304 domain-containing protein [Pseudonocardia sp. H11422]|uniref:DUF2304 domain-containing protein n=1 Tax=Pseudonocardia sp. H11422 TaxID=2835866 RepID=UPI001BDD07F9|nr:DUF2304 domain-containing protein [Pseudonocardia sp. H11422]